MFWVKISDNGMPTGVVKREFYPSELGWGWECFGERGELERSKKKIKELEEKLEKTEKHLKWVAETYCTED